MSLVKCKKCSKTIAIRKTIDKDSYVCPKCIIRYAKKPIEVYSMGYTSDEISPCVGCHCMTKSIREGRAKYRCGKCGRDKSLSDVFYSECKNKNKNIWGLGQKHPHFGKVVMMRTIENEPYRFFEKDGVISMIPLATLHLEESQ